MRCLDAEESKIDGGRSLELPSGDDAWFGFVRTGAIKVTLSAGEQQKTGRVAYGGVFLVPPHCTCVIRNMDRRSTQLLLIRFQSEESGTAVPSPRQFLLTDGKGLRLHHFWMPRLHNWIRDFLNEEWKRDVSLYLLVHSHLYAIAAECMETAKQPPGRDDDLINYVIGIKQNMLEHGQDELDIEEMARLSGASSARFYKMFKKYTGLSPLQYMTSTRLEESLRLLSNQPSAIKDVAHAVGYGDELYFSRLFKKQMGLAPSEYAVRAKRRIANLSPVFKGDLSVLGITPILELPRGWYDSSEQEDWLLQIEQCRPDLILTSPVPENIHMALSAIAPVLMIQWKGYSWKERLLQIGRHLDISSVAERWLSGYQQKVENARQHLQRHYGETPFLLVSIYEPFYRVYGLKRMKMTDLFYEELQITAPDAVQEITFLDVPSLAEVAALDCNQVLFLTPASMSDAECIKLEKAWLGYKREGQPRRCVFLRHEEPLLYNACFYQNLIDRVVNYLFLNGS
ncbi:hypothetical protein CIG75_01015 [Tumebacillus algifaecis]|uniref:HTH araC/xylS-type domain-containing protein n=1 Tax=Tumebacillus algifaecis TaxID=1214604 RepID=A0A223CX15_9BACL|nr:AraC family transcriptional regulator [Tumebacillus algifaecis]ASS73693.1 hypothetical protein CIG75_01015 [Tumebacillus algifaecis]